MLLVRTFARYYIRGSENAFGNLLGLSGDNMVSTMLTPTFRAHFLEVEIGGFLRHGAFKDNDKLIVGGVRKAFLNWWSR